MLGLFKKKPEPRQPKPRPDDATISKLANMISQSLSIQLALLPPDTRIETKHGNFFLKSIGYVFGYVDAFLTSVGYDMSDLQVGPPITFHVFRKLFELSAFDAQRYIEFLMKHMQDQTVALGMMVGGQQYIDYMIKKRDGVPMGLFRFICEEQVTA